MHGWNNLRWVPVAIALSVAACSHRQQRPPELAPLRPMPDQIASFIRAAIADRYQAGDIPDQGLIRDKVPVLVFDEMERSAYRVPESALPTVEGTRFALIDRTAARDSGYGTRSGTLMLEVDEVEVGDRTAQLKMGVAVYPDVGTPGLIVLCCCSATASFRLVDGRWSFAGWDARHCD